MKNDEHLFGKQLKQQRIREFIAQSNQAKKQNWSSKINNFQNEKQASINQFNEVKIKIKGNRSKK